jgi:large subunit ribosomal protein L24
MQRLKVGDLVEVRSGSHKGKRGKVVRIVRGPDGADRVVVEGVNVRIRHMRPSQRNPEGGRNPIEAPLAASKLMPIDAGSDKPTRVRTGADEQGRKRRAAAKTGAELKQA